MRVSLIAPALCAMTSVVSAYPGMGAAVAAINKRAADSSGDSDELIGDLATLRDDQLTPVGKSVKKIILDQGEDGESNEMYKGRVPGKDTPQCAKDTCCIWTYVAQDMVKAFKGPSGRCTALARGAVRLGFHDAAGWSKATAPGGGADGSIVLAPEEMARVDNRGLEEIVAQTKQWYGTYRKYGVGMADLIQMGATVATVVCPLGPRIRSYVGRKDSTTPCPDHLLPPVTQSADFLIELFENKTIKPHGLTALIGAHTTSQQRFVDPSRALDPQDSTPGVWDVKFYAQTLGNAPKRVFRFASDIKLAKDPRIAQEFQEFARDQPHWNEDYAREYVRLSLLGVYNINSLTECTKVLPPKIGGGFHEPDRNVIDKWLQTTDRVPQIAKDLEKGLNVGGLLNVITGILNRFKSKFTGKY